MLGGDIDKSASDGEGDKIIGGYEWVDSDNDDIIDIEDGEMVKTSGEPGDQVGVLTMNLVKKKLVILKIEA